MSVDTWTQLAGVNRYELTYQMMYAQFKPAYQVRQVDVLAAVYEGLPIRLGRLKSCKQYHAISSKQDEKKARSFSFKRKGKEGD